MRPNTSHLWESFGLTRNAEGATRSESLRLQDRRLVVGSGERSEDPPKGLFVVNTIKLNSQVNGQRGDS